jgi:hypothetical protein
MLFEPSPNFVVPPALLQPQEPFKESAWDRAQRARVDELVACFMAQTPEVQRRIMGMLNGIEFFVVWRDDGRFWGDGGWVVELVNAVQFRGPGDPYAECEKVAAGLRGEGHSCSPGFVPSRKSWPRRSRGRTPR